MSIETHIRNEAWAAGIPSSLVCSVVARFRAAHEALKIARAWRMGRERPVLALGELVERIVKRARADHERGVLERVCEPAR